MVDPTSAEDANPVSIPFIVGIVSLLAFALVVDRCGAGQVANAAIVIAKSALDGFCPLDNALFVHHPGLAGDFPAGAKCNQAGDACDIESRRRLLGFIGV